MALYRPSTEVDPRVALARAHVPGWSDDDDVDEGHHHDEYHYSVGIVSGGLTNSLSVVRRIPNSTKRFKSSGSSSETTTSSSAVYSSALVRTYGQGTSDMVDRSVEERTAEFLGNVAKLAPRIFGSFPDGRVEEFIENSRSLTCSELGKEFSLNVAFKLGELHTLSIPGVDPTINSVRNRLVQWTTLAENVHSSLRTAKTQTIREVRRAKKLQGLHVESLRDEVEWLIEFLQLKDGDDLFFLHSDLQEGNVLLVTEERSSSLDPTTTKTKDPLVLIDFEYAGYGPRGFDFSNTFCEMAVRYDVRHYPGFVLDPDGYPSKAQQRGFFKAYLKGFGVDEPLEKDVDELCEEARKHAMCSHLTWTLWAVRFVASWGVSGSA